MPTPVSALIHAATLVTAGLYLLLRSSPLLEYSSTALLVITLTGATTAFFAATCGLVQNDLKRIIAFSTISQLGYMVMAVGLSQYNVALMHVVNHAFFKALLFLGAGAVIHSFADEQDIRKMGGLIKFLPFTYTAMLVGSLSLLATPWLTGFYSKDLIIELAYGQYSFSGIYAFILALFSILFGFVFSDLFVGVGSDFFANSIFINPNNISIIEAEFSLPLIIKLLPTLLSILGATSAIFIYHIYPDFIINLTDSSLGKKIYTFLNGKYFFDVIYNYYIISAGLFTGNTISKVLDRGVIELLGPYGLASVLENSANNIAELDTGVITTYSLYITIGILSLVFLVFAPLLLDTYIISEFRLIVIFISALFFSLFPILSYKN